MKHQDRKASLAAYKERKIIGGVYAVKNTANGKMLLLSTTDLQGSKNRFLFTQDTGTCTFTKLQKDWADLGGGAFSFEVLEELEKNEKQTAEEFQKDVKTLEEIWLEKIDPDTLY